MNHLIEQPWIQALGWTLLHATWQACLVTASWAIMRKFLSKASAKHRYLLAISALPVLILCAAITFWKVYPETISNPVEAVALDAIDFSTFEGLSLSKINFTENEKSWKDLLHGLTPWLSVIWILGAAIMGLRFSAGLWFLQRLRSEGLHSVAPSWQTRAENIAQKMGIQSNWKLWESELVSEPLTLGHFKPIILIPAGMLSGLSPDQVEAIIAHEFAHIYRADFLFNLIQSLIEILFFFHPAVWWLSKEIRRERELCCDDLAVATLGDAFTYAEALTRLQSFCHSPKHFLTMQAKGNSGSFTARIHRLFAPSLSGPSLWKSFSAALLLSMAILGSGYYAYTQSHEFTSAPVEEALEDQGYEFLMFSSDASLEDLDLFINEMQVEYGLDLEVLDFALNDKGHFQMMYLSYFEPKKQLKRGYKATNFQHLIFEIDPSRDTPLQLGFSSKEHEEAVMETIDLEPITEEVSGPPVHTNNDQSSVAKKVLAKFNISPDLSDKKFEKIKKKLAKYRPDHFPVIERNAAGKIVDFYFLVAADGEKHRIGIRNFSKLEIQIKPGEEGKPVIGLKDPIGNPYFIDQAIKDIPELDQPVQELPVLVYLDGQSMGFYEGGVNEVFPQLIQQGIIQAHEDIGKVSFYAIENGDMYPFFQSEQLPPPPPVSKPEPHPKKFNVYVLNSWEYLANKYEKEGKEKHRFYIFNEKIVGFKKGEIGTVLAELLDSSSLDKSRLKGLHINAKKTYEKYNVRAVEVVEFTFTDKQDSEKPTACKNCEEKREQKEARRIKENWKFDTEEGKYEVNGEISFLSDTDKVGNESNNFYFFDGKPLGYRRGDVFEVIAKELSKRNLKKIGGIVVCDADKLDPSAGKVVQILSEEYEATYYQRIKATNGNVLNLDDLDPNSEVRLDGEIVSVEALKQIDPYIVVSIHLLGPESIQKDGRDEVRGPVILVRTNANIEKPEISTTYDFDKKVDVEREVDLNLTVSPNPSSEIFNIKFKLDQKIEVHFTITDVVGKVIHKSGSEIFEAGSHKIKWKADKVANGYYQVRLETAEGIVATQMIVKK